MESLWRLRELIQLLSENMETWVRHVKQPVPLWRCQWCRGRWSPLAGRGCCSTRRSSPGWGWWAAAAAARWWPRCEETSWGSSPRSSCPGAPRWSSGPATGWWGRRCWRCGSGTAWTAWSCRPGGPGCVAGCGGSDTPWPGGRPPAAGRPARCWRGRCFCSSRTCTWRGNKPPDCV